MNETMTMSKKEFAERICQYVKNALPEELADAEVRATSLDLWTGDTRMVLLVIRPWDGVTTGFCLDKWYNGSPGRQIIEAAASIINDRRLYCMPHGDKLDLQGSAIIYA